MNADLHCHSTVSDGQFAPAEVARRAHAGGVTLWALTDHDEVGGQAEARAILKIFIEAAKNRGEALDHVLFVGPPGLGKTTLAQIMAKELGVNFRSTSGPVIAMMPPQAWATTS